jgi:hypothetical protein
MIDWRVREAAIFGLVRMGRSGGKFGKNIEDVPRNVRMRKIKISMVPRRNFLTQWSSKENFT